MLSSGLICRYRKGARAMHYIMSYYIMFKHVMLYCFIPCCIMLHIIILCYCFMLHNILSFCLSWADMQVGLGAKCQPARWLCCVPLVGAPWG